MNNIYITNVKDAPSLSGIIFSDYEIDKINWLSMVQIAYKKICEAKINLSKMAIVYKKSDNLFDFKFIQVKKNNDKINFETNANCGNSMLAVAKVIFSNLNNKEDIVIKNIDTNFEIMIKDMGDCFIFKVLSLENKNINSFKMSDKSSGEYKIFYNGKKISYSLVNVVNEYILIKAEDIGIRSIEELLSLDENDNIYFPMVKEIRKNIIEKNNLRKESEFPKIAVVYDKGNLAARTVYLNNWHSGLPLTGAITIMFATKMKDSILYKNNNCNDTIFTTKGEKIIKIDNDVNGNIINVISKFEKDNNTEKNLKII